MKHSQLFAEVRAELSSITESAEEYVTSEDSPLANFLDGMMYAEVQKSQIDLSRISDEAAEAVKALLKLPNWRTKLRSFCELTYVPDMYIRDGEILNSGNIGEQEHQLDSSMDVVAKIKQLSPEEFALIKREFLASRSKQEDKSFWFYTVHNYERWALILDEDAILSGTKEGSRE